MITLEQRKEWFKEAKYGMMVHWGLYALLAGEWRGKRCPGIAEWIQHKLTIPVAEYDKLASAFNPIYFDAEEMVKLAKDVGMQYIVVTSKHHEGFAMYHSKVDKFNVVDATPFGRDVIGEIAEACYKHDLKLGLYYSQYLDWHEPHGGGFEGTGANYWDYPIEGRNYELCFRSKILPQVKEILTQYGDLCLIWFDTPREMPEALSRELYDVVRTLQPACLVNSRISNTPGIGDYTSTRDNQIPDDDKGNMLWESPATINGTWGYKACDQNWKSPERILEIKRHLNERGINYLLNIGPDHLGRIPISSVEILREVARLEKEEQ